MIQQQIDRLRKQHFGKMVTSLLHSFQEIDPAMAEEIVGDSFSSALKHWKLRGIPINAPGWIYGVCKKRAAALYPSTASADSGSPSAYPHATSATPGFDPADAETLFPGSTFEDRKLRVLFACARNRISSVHNILYLIFHAGYTSPKGHRLFRKNLCEEALLLIKALIDSPFANNETAALYALLLFNSARFNSRFPPTGELIQPEDQDPDQWDMDLISLACNFLHQAARSETISAYYQEASAACLFCLAKNNRSAATILTRSFPAYMP